jgi:hypothetical protein
MRCIDFYHKWEKDPNWCEKTKGAVTQINSYLDLVSEISSRGIDKDIIYAKFPDGAARPVISIKDPEIRVKVLNYLCSCLNRSEKVQAGDLKNLISSYEGKEKPEKHVEDRPERFTFVNPDAPLPVENPPPRPPTPAPCLDPLPPLSDDADITERLKRDEVLLVRAGFTRASELATPIYPPPLKILAVPLTKAEANQRITDVVRGYLTPKDQTAVAMLIGTGELGDTPLELFEALIWEAADRMGV